MDNKELDKLEALAKAATPGPWRTGSWTGHCKKPSHAGGRHPGAEGNDQCVYEPVFMEGLQGIAGPEAGVVWSSYDGVEMSEADAAYIAAANPAAILELIRLARAGIAAPTGQQAEGRTLMDQWTGIARERAARAIDALDGMGFTYDEEIGWLPPVPDTGIPTAGEAPSKAVIQAAHVAFSEALPPMSLTSLGHANVYRALEEAVREAFKMNAAFAACRAPVPTTPTSEEVEKADAPTCWCHACNKDRTVGGFPYSMTTMILCPTCGNKRCPHANDHRNACTGSNEVGQPGSAYLGPSEAKAGGQP